jgi:hypothetical protein
MKGRCKISWEEEAEGGGRARREKVSVRGGKQSMSIECEYECVRSACVLTASFS